MFVGIGMGVTAGRGGDDAGLSWADGLNFQRDRHRLNGVVYASLMAVPGVAYARTGAATAWRADGTLAEFAPNVPRITERGVLIEGQRTNLDPWSRNNPGWIAAGTTPPSVNGDVTEDGRRCVSVTFPTLENGGYAVSRAEVSGPANSAQVEKDKTYIWSADVKLSRALVTGEGIHIYYTGVSGITGVSVDAVQQHVGWKRLVPVPSVAAVTGSVAIRPYAVRLLSPLTVFLTNRQLEQASTPSSPIITTGAAATRGADNLRLSLTKGPEGTAMVEWVEPVMPHLPGNPRLLGTNGMTSSSLINFISNSASITETWNGSRPMGVEHPLRIAGQTYRAALSWGAFGRKLAALGILANDAQQVSAFTEVTIGSAPAAQTYITRCLFLPRALTDAELVELTR